jgi:SAM-dependent methyltransferase
MGRKIDNVYDDEQRARAYAELGFPGTYYLAFRDLPGIVTAHVSEKRALDFGCGTGRSTRFLRGLGFGVIGVDISRPMLEKARELDPTGDYQHLAGGDLSNLQAGPFDLILSAFTFDNIPNCQEKKAALLSLKRLMGEGSRLVSVVSSPEIYVHEWASFSTRDYPENRKARSGDQVYIVMLDVADRRPVEDILCTDEDYLDLYHQTGLSVIDKVRPLATGTEPIAWKSELQISPWVIYVLGNNT